MSARNMQYIFAVFDIQGALLKGGAPYGKYNEYKEAPEFRGFLLDLLVLGAAGLALADDLVVRDHCVQDRLNDLTGVS